MHFHQRWILKRLVLTGLANRSDGSSRFNSTQCLYLWIIPEIGPYVDEIFGMITHVLLAVYGEKWFDDVKSCSGLHGK